MRTLQIVAFVLSLALVPVAQGQRETLKVGDAAPAMDIEAWLGGEPVQISPNGVYVVIFWEKAVRGTTPDRSITRGQRFAEVFAAKGLEIIYVAQETLEEVQGSFRTKLPDRGLRIAIDRRGRTERDWVRAAGKTAPVAFLVGKGKIMHIGGHGDPDFENIVVQVLTGRYDPELQRKAQPQLDSARRARRLKNWRMAIKTYDEVTALDAQVFAVIALERFEMMLVDMGDRQAAYEYARTGLIGQLFSRDPGALRMLAVTIVASPDIDNDLRDLDVAQLAADGAVELAGPSDPEALATAALVHYHRGEHAEAVMMQSRAYFLARPAEKPEYRRVLDTYRGAAQRSGAKIGQ